MHATTAEHNEVSKYLLTTNKIMFYSSILFTMKSLCYLFTSMRMKGFIESHFFCYSEQSHCTTLEALCISCKLILPECRIYKILLRLRVFVF